MIQTLIRNMTVVVGVPISIAYNSGALQMYAETSWQKLSFQFLFWQIDTQSWLLCKSSGWPGYQFVNPSVLLSDVQVNVPSSYLSFPPIQYWQQFNQSVEQADRKKMWWKRRKQQYNHARPYLIRVVFIELVINMGFITGIMLYQTLQLELL